MAYRILKRKWRSSTAMWIVMLAELGITIGLLILTALAHPNVYRDKLWQAGYELGYNSSPAQLLYAYAMGKPIPVKPFVWSPLLTNFNFSIAIVSLFFLIAKLIGYIMDIWFPLPVLFINIGLTVLYAVSVGGQAGPDHLDPNQQSNVAWYIAHSCSVAKNQSIQKYCTDAKTLFGVTFIMLLIMAVNTGLTVWALIPNDRDKRDWDSDDEDDDEDEPLDNKRGTAWEMRSIPPTPRTGVTPFTPRTTAFNTLDRKLPMRSNQYTANAYA
ncbi:hypothetical protein GGR57DRAFT_455976 [Xylariaceae sp. FL1272]|nr:hypothetical protein GGR57DRAFT_455976 [Xylariaceae sp. FL1272]